MLNCKYKVTLSKQWQIHDFHNGGPRAKPASNSVKTRPERPASSRLLLFTTQARPQSLKMASTSDNSSDSNAIPLTENDIPGASLLGRKPEELKNSELKLWLKCRGDTEKGLNTKAELVKRVYEYIRSGKDKQIIDPELHKIYSRRKQKQGTSSELVKESTAAAEFPTAGWGTSFEKMPMFTRLQMNHHVLKFFCCQ